MCPASVRDRVLSVCGGGVLKVYCFNYVSLCRHVHMGIGVCGVQKVLDPLELEVEVAVSCETWGLESNLGPLQKQQCS